MLLVFLFSLICLSSSVPLKKMGNSSINLKKSVETGNLLQVILKNKKDPAYLLSVLSNVNPADLNAVIVLVEALLAASEADLAALTLGATEADNAYNAATTTYDEAVLLKIALVGEESQIQVDLDAKAAEVAQQTNVVSASLTAQTEAQGAKTNAQNTHDTETTRLGSEILTLKQVIALLVGLGAKTVVAATAGPETLITPGGRDGWTGFSMLNTNAVVPAHESNQGVRLVGWQWNGFDNGNTITLQIYRQTSGTNYQLIGQNTYDSQQGLNEMTLGTSLAVESGDVVGWTFHGSAAVGHTGGPATTRWGQNNVQFNGVGNTYNFPGSGGRNYPIKANFEIYGL